MYTKFLNNMAVMIATVLILALCTPSVDAFIQPHRGRILIQKVTTTSLEMGLLDPIRNFFKSSKKKKEELDEKAKTLIKKADAALDDFGDYLVDAMKRKSDEVINEVAVEAVTFLSGKWDISVAIDRSGTSAMMEGAIDDMAADLVELGLADADAADDTKAALKAQRLRWTTTWDATTYPLGVENSVYVGDIRAITYYGQFQFDIVEKRAVFSLDELAVFGVKVDLERVIEQYNKEKEEKDDDGKPDDKKESSETESSDSDEKDETE